MDILYILGSGSRWNNNELRYSLRSLEKHGKNYNRLFLTGEKPDFMKDNVIYNYQPDKHIGCINHFLKVLWTFQNTDISDDILLNYDDNFFIKNVDISTCPFYYRAEVIPEAFTVNNKHTRSLLFTKQILKSLDKPVKNFEVHCPIIYNRHKFYEFAYKFTKFIDFNDKQKGLLPRSCYLNNFEVAGKYISDCKIKKIISKQEIELAIKGRDIFSISGNVISGGIVEFLKENYPNKSRWER